jgi:hypothetical protein
VQAIGKSRKSRSGFRLRCEKFNRSGKRSRCNLTTGLPVERFNRSDTFGQGQKGDLLRRDANLASVVGVGGHGSVLLQAV